MNHIKPGVLLAHCMQCFAETAQSIADCAMRYEQGQAQPGWTAKDAGKMPIFDAAFCADVFDGEYSNWIEDGDGDQAQANLHWLEFRQHLVGFFGEQACAKLPLSFE